MELGNRGSDHPPLYPMKEQTLPKTKSEPQADERAGSFIFSPPTDTASNGHQNGSEPVKGSPEPQQVSLNTKVAKEEESGLSIETKVELHN